jgi:hypothetical protein
MYIAKEVRVGDQAQCRAAVKTKEVMRRRLTRDADMATISNSTFADNSETISLLSATTSF